MYFHYSFSLSGGAKYLGFEIAHVLQKYLLISESLQKLQNNIVSRVLHLALLLQEFVKSFLARWPTHQFVPEIKFCFVVKSIKFGRKIQANVHLCVCPAHLARKVLARVLGLNRLCVVQEQIICLCWFTHGHLWMKLWTNTRFSQ